MRLQLLWLDASNKMHSNAAQTRVQSSHCTRVSKYKGAACYIILHTALFWRMRTARALPQTLNVYEARDRDE